MSMSFQEHTESVAEALRWLIGSADPENAECICTALQGKTFNYLLPMFSLSRVRGRFCRLVPNALLRSALEPLYIAAVQYRLSGQSYPETMEIRCRKVHGEISQDLIGLSGPICLVASMGSYISPILKVAQECIERGYETLLLIPDQFDRGVLATMDSRVQLVVLEEFVTGEMERSHDEAVEDLESRYGEIEAIFSSSEIPELIRDLYRVCPGQLRYVYTRIIPQVELYCRLARYVIKTLQPRALFVARLKRITESTIATSARSADVPVLLINHGHIDPEWPVAELGRVDDLCDVVFAWNESQRSIWLNWFPALTASRVHLTGGVQWDVAIRKGLDGQGKKQCRNEVSSRLELDSDETKDERWIVITIDGHLKPELACIMAGLREIAGLRVLVKIRPDETTNDYLDLLWTSSCNSHIISNSTEIDLSVLLLAADLAMTCVSTTNLDSLAVGTPVLTVLAVPGVESNPRTQNLGRFGLPVAKPYAVIGLIESWLKRQEIFDAWREAANLAARALLANYPAGDAGDRIICFMEELIAARRDGAEPGYTG